MVESTAELYVHAIAMEREAAERYAEFARHMADEGNDAVDLFRRVVIGGRKAEFPLANGCRDAA